jgi:oligopeptide/dipeptide ABC transporter ATP-binding protein
MLQALDKSIKKDTSSPPFLAVNNLVKHFNINQGYFKPKLAVKAVNNISFQLHEGETYGLVGESGCGKSTTGRMILQLIEATSGEVIYKGKNITELSENELQKIRQEMQIVFQDPYSALNPRIRIGKAIEEGMKIFNVYNKKERKEKALELLEKVGLNADQYYRYPHEFSGGQRQRIVLARALAVNPKFIVCDEPVSALDVSIQSQIINLLEELQVEFDLTYLFIAHDLSVVHHICDRVGVMYLGHLMEEAPTEKLFEKPLHPYTQALLSAVPVANPKNKKERIVLSGDVPSPLNLPTGCVFHTRCPFAMKECKEKVPEYKEVEKDRRVACHLY